MTDRGRWPQAKVPLGSPEKGRKDRPLEPWEGAQSRRTLRSPF